MALDTRKAGPGKKPGPQVGGEYAKEGCPEGPRTPAGPAKLIVLRLGRAGDSDR